ncbi:MAG: glycosyltransferase family 2 protein [Dehalococcoidia bacterium]
MPGLGELPLPATSRYGWPWTRETASLAGRCEGQSAWPQISIVTPSFNQASFLEETMRSVLQQDYPALEYLVLDGGSTDGSADLLTRYAPNLQYAVSAPDGGQTEAINTGLARSSGEIVAYLNSDDLYCPGALQEVARVFSAQPDLDILYGERILLIDENSALIGIDRAPSFSIERLLRGDFIFQPTTFMRRRVIERAGPFDPSLRYVMDYEFFLRAALAGCRFERYDGPPLAAFRLHSQSKTLSKATQGLQEELAMLDKVFASPALSSHLRQLHSRARAQCYLNVGYSQYLGGAHRTARRYLRAALGEHRALVMERSFLWLLAKTMLLPRPADSLVSCGAGGVRE